MICRKISLSKQHQLLPRPAKTAREYSMKFDSEGFGRRLKEYRIKNHLSQEELAEKIDAVPSSVSHLENGTHAPSLKTLIRLCSAMNIGVDALLCDSLPVTDFYLDKDIASLLADCSKREKQILKDIIIVTKQTLRKYPL